MPAVVLNKPGSGGLVGGDFVAKSKPDGYNLLVLSLSHLLRQAIDPQMPFDVLKDFDPICLYVTQPLVFVVKGDSRFKTIEEMIDFGLKNPGKLSMGSAGIGATSHFSGELFKVATKVNYKHVPFAGDAPNITALMGGHIDFLVTGLPIVSGKVASGDLRLLASFEETRLPEMKDVPTFKEKGYPEAIMYSWFGFVAPKGTPKDILGKLDSSLKSAIKDPVTQGNIKKIGFNESYKGPAEFDKFIKFEFDRFNKVTKEEGIVMK
jgi:tripartite-type tricarboxylate transporter receptor subunit TctC